MIETGVYWLLRLPFLLITYYLGGLVVGVTIVSRLVYEGLPYIAHLPACEICARHWTLAALTWGPSVVLVIVIIRHIT